MRITVSQSAVQTTKLILLHIVCVFCFVCYETGFLFFSDHPFNWLVLITHYAIDIVWFYLLALSLFPLISKTKNGLFQKLILGAICIGGFVVTLITANQLWGWYQTGSFKILESTAVLFRSVWRAVYITTIALCYWYAQDRFKKAKMLQQQTALRYEAEKKTLELENDYLRAQINPHLLFNSLTYLYKEVLTRIPEASGAVMLLSEMMDYALAPVHTDGMVYINDEVAHINRLIQLHQLLHPRSKAISFHSAIGNADALVPPLIFNHFIENVLKHGVLDDESHPATISLNDDKGYILFEIDNASRQHTCKGRGSGIINTRTRLNRHYENRHTLKIFNNGFHYRVQLILQP